VHIKLQIHYLIAFDVMVSMLVSSAVDHRFEYRSGQTKDYLLLLRYTRNINEKEQRPGGAESG